MLQAFRFQYYCMEFFTYVFQGFCLLFRNTWLLPLFNSLICSLSEWFYWNRILVIKRILHCINTTHVNFLKWWINDKLWSRALDILMLTCSLPTPSLFLTKCSVCWWSLILDVTDLVMILCQLCVPTNSLALEIHFLVFWLLNACNQPWKYY